MRIVGARSAAALAAWLVTVSVTVGPAWGGTLSLLAITAIDFGVAPLRPVEAGVDADELLAERPVPRPAASWLRLTGSVSDPEAVDLQALLERGERWRLVHLGAVAKPRHLEARMTVFGEIPYIDDDSTAGVQGPGATYEPASLGVKAEAAGFEVGAVYRSVGTRPERFVRAAYRVDRRGPEVWVARRAGPVRVRVSQSRLWDNVDGDRALPRTTEKQTAVSAELAVPLLPVLGLTYVTGDAEHESLAPEALAERPERHAFERVTGSMAYGGARWHLLASTSLSETRDAARAHGDTVTTSHAVSLSLRAADAVTVAPTVSFGQAREEWSAVRGDTGAVSVALVYAPPQNRWFASTVMSYAASSTSDGTVDERAFGVNAAVGCRLARRFGTYSTLWLETGYGRYLDGALPERSSAAAWVSVSLRLAAF